MERFWSHVDKSGDHWLWTAGLDDGYGVVKWQGKARRAHHVAWMLLRGDLPTGGLEPDHLCRIRNCVNPDCIEWVTKAVNNERGIPRCAKITHCPQGHPYSGDNLWVSAGKRTCKTCRQAQARSRREAMKGSPLNPPQKLPDEEVHKIAARYRGGEATQTQLAAEYGVKPSTVSKAIKRLGL